MATEKTVFIGAAILVAVMIYGCPAFCDFVVVGSQSKSLEVGSEIQDSAVIEIGDQETLRLIDKKTIETRILIGPYKGTVGNYVAAPSKERSKSLGASRGLRKEE